MSRAGAVSYTGNFTHAHTQRAESIRVKLQINLTLSWNLHSLKAHTPVPGIYSLGPVDYSSPPGKQSGSVNQCPKDDHILWPGNSPLGIYPQEIIQLKQGATCSKDVQDDL